MEPTSFPECNTVFGPPKGLTEAQVRSVPAHVTEAKGGSLDGLLVVVVAWQPTEHERAAIAAGQPVYVSMIGSLQPHFLTTEFQEAITPA